MIISDWFDGLDYSILIIIVDYQSVYGTICVCGWCVDYYDCTFTTNRYYFVAINTVRYYDDTISLELLLASTCRVL